LISQATPGEATVDHTYTATGKYATTTDASGTTTYTYDSMDRLVAKATPEGTLNYTVNAIGKVASIASGNVNGASMGYSYDSLERLSTVVDNRLAAGHNTTTYTYDAANNLATATYPNGLTSTFTYDSLNRLTELATPPVADYRYSLGVTGLRTGVTEQSGRTANWSYDGIYRLTNEAISLSPAGNYGSVGYGLDPVGNRQTEAPSISGLPSGSFTFNADDQLANETYDANGNTLTTGGKTFGYDAENKLTSMNGGAVTIVYDGFGNRVAKTVGGVTTRYLVEDDVNPTGYPQVMDELVGGVVQRIYTYGLQRIDEDQIVNHAWTPSFYGYDGFGNVRQLTNAAGTVTDTYEYDAFGHTLTTSGTTPNNYLYRGEEYDSDLGLYYLRARYYNPATGRFLSRDPEDGKSVDPKTLHKYLYASGDPVNGIDPRGREELAEGIEVDFIEIGTSTALEKAKFIVGPGLCSATINWYVYDLLKGADWPDAIAGGLFNIGCLVGLAILG
jgi:RHS repeat-associated protein